MSLQKPSTLVIVALAAAGWPHGAAQAQVRVDVPVFIPSGDGQMANCAFGQVVGLDPRGDGFLSVRSGPGGQPYREIDRLHNGQEVHMCDRQGPWVAVVYKGARQAVRSCGVERPSPVRWSYAGPCLHGWIHQRYVRATAG